MPTAVPTWAAIDDAGRAAAPVRADIGAQAGRGDGGQPDAARPPRRTGTAQGLSASGISMASAAAIRARPAATTGCGRSQALHDGGHGRRGDDRQAERQTVAAASSGLRRSVFCRYNVTKVMTGLVVAVFRKPPSAPSRSARSPVSWRGSSGGAARRSMSTNSRASTAHPARARPPVTCPPGRVMTVVPTTNAITAAVNAADPARFSDSGRWSPVSGGTETAMIARRGPRRAGYRPRTQPANSSGR